MKGGVQPGDYRASEEVPVSISAPQEQTGSLNSNEKIGLFKRPWKGKQKILMYPFLIKGWGQSLRENHLYWFNRVQGNV